MCDGREAAVLNLGCIERDGVFGEFETLLDEGCEFANSSALLAEDLLSVCCADDWIAGCQMGTLDMISIFEISRMERTDISDGWSHSNFDAGVAFLRQLALEEFIQFGVEDTIGHEFAALGDGTLRSSHDCVRMLSSCYEGTLQNIGLAIRKRKFQNKGIEKFSPNLRRMEKTALPVSMEVEL